jgi:hypothetical protein
LIGVTRRPKGCSTTDEPPTPTRDRGQAPKRSSRSETSPKRPQPNLLPLFERIGRRILWRGSHRARSQNQPSTKQVNLSPWPLPGTRRKKLESRSRSGFLRSVHYAAVHNRT